jgi:hypothetical protein
MSDEILGLCFSEKTLRDQEDESCGCAGLKQSRIKLTRQPLPHTGSVATWPIVAQRVDRVMRPIYAYFVGHQREHCEEVSTGENWLQGGTNRLTVAFQRYIVEV